MNKVIKNIVEDEMKELISFLNKHTKLYDEGRPTITDEEWDNAYFKLLDLESSCGYTLPESPTQKIVYEVKNSLNKVSHVTPMLSLDKTKNIEDIKRFIDGKEWICMLKMDGLTCRLTYKNHKLICAETRGNGVVGEDITHNAMVIPSIPKYINAEKAIVDGEIICTYNSFKEFENEYKNPRNFASGSIRLLDNKECAQRKLTFVAWDWIDSDKKLLSEKLYNLSDEMNFIAVPHFENEDFDKCTNLLQTIAKENGYPIDGLVFKYNNVEEYQQAGKTSHHFRGGLALKFYDEEYESKLLDVEWTMGRVGQLTPVAIFEPIDIEGTSVSRANLHNINVMKETLHGNGFVGQLVKIAKMNMIIPQVVGSEPNKNEKELSIPTRCPYCGGSLEIHNNDGVQTLWCTSLICDARLINKLDHFFGKKGIDAKGISKSTLEKLIDWDWVNNVTDVLSLEEYRKDWVKKRGWGEKSVDKVLQGINVAREVEFSKFISAIGIPLIGVSEAKKLCSNFKGYKDFRNAINNGYDFSKLDGFGYQKAKAITNFNYREFDNIIENGLIHIKKEPNEIVLDNLKGVTFCITGKLHNYKNRDELVAEIEARGGKVVSSVTSKTDYLINNDANSNSSKNVAAHKLNILIITEDEFDRVKNL